MIQNVSATARDLKTLEQPMNTELKKSLVRYKQIINQLLKNKFHDYKIFKEKESGSEHKN